MIENYLFNGHLEICGAIASGKTTLAKFLKQLDVQPVLEDFRSNPFYELFYKDSAKYAFETEITFLLQHYNQTMRALEANRAVVCDFSPFLDLAYADVTLNRSENSAFRAVYDEVRNKLPSPIVLVHLECDTHTLLERIKKRGRSAESSITAEYLDAIKQSLALQLQQAAKTVRIVSINSSVIDFLSNKADQDSVLSLIRDLFNIG